MTTTEIPLDAALAGWDAWLVSMALELQRETGSSLH